MWNRILRASSSKKTGLGHRHWRLLAGVLGLIIIFFVWSGVATAPESGKLVVKNQEFRVEFADSPMAQEKGLGGRDFLPFDHAMVFRYASSAKQCFWMKDMRFSLDIIWLSSDKRVVHIEPNVSPETYPKSYCPNEPAKYVVEVNAGTSQQLELHTGDAIDF